MPFSKIRTPVTRALTALFFGLALASVVQISGITDRLEWKLYDLKARHLAVPGAASKKVVVVLLDQNSLDWAKKENGLSWPWPRQIWGAILDFCKASGAKAVGLDILFTEPSFYGTADDLAFGKAAAGFGASAGAIFLADTAGDATRYPETFPPPPALLPRKPPVKKRAALPVSPVGEHFRILGNVGLAPDPDGIYRRVRLFTRFDGHSFPALALATWLSAHPDAALSLAQKSATIGTTRVPLHSDQTAMLRFRGPSRTHTTISAAAILRAELLRMQGKDPEFSQTAMLQDAYVLIGFSAPGLHDLTPVPVSPRFPGVEVHATLLDNLITNDFIRFVPPALFWGLVLLTAGLAAFTVTLFPGVTGPLLMTAAGCLLPVLSAKTAYQAGWNLLLIPHCLAMLGSTAAAVLINYATEGRQKRFIKNAFSQYLSPAVIDELILHPDKLTLGGEKREISIFFSDLEGFTTLSEGLDPEALTALLNHYLTAMTEIIQAEGGTVDKYEGDAIIAFWNAPLPYSDHADRAVRAALLCQDRLAAMGEEIRGWTSHPLRMRIGINTGYAVVGNLGSKTRFDYTMLGDAVNLAARLEGVNKEFSTYTMISQFTAAQLGPEFRLRELARVMVVGKNKAVQVFEPKWAKQPKATDPAFAAALRQFYAGNLTDARRAFSAIAHLDPAAYAYAEKCRKMHNLSPDAWTGIWVMNRK